MSDHYYDWDGKPITQEMWLAAWQRNRKVAPDAHFECPSGTATVSTVYLGLDHSFGGGPPVIFESLIYCACEEEIMARYSTKEEAKSGHEELVKLHRSRESFLLEDGWTPIPPT